MDFRLTLFSLPVLLISCAAPNMDQVPGTSPLTEGKVSYTVSIQGFEGTYVACELDKDSADKAMLACNRATPGDWEKFTLFELGDNKIALQAANGKYVCSEEKTGGLLVADRDGIGEWETFTLVPQVNGTVALQAWNKKYVTADFGLADQRKGALFGIREEANDWERFTLVKDVPSVQ